MTTKRSRQAYCFVGNEVQNCLLVIFFRRNEHSSTAGFNSLLCSVLTTEYTEWQLPLSGLHYIMIEKLAQAGERGGARPPPFTLVSITYKVPVYAPEAVDTNGRFQMQGGKNWILPK